MGQAEGGTSRPRLTSCFCYIGLPSNDIQKWLTRQGKEEEAGPISFNAFQNGAIMATSDKRVVHRDAGDGQFVTKRYAETHKQTTVREHVPAPKPAPAPSKPSKK